VGPSWAAGLFYSRERSCAFRPGKKSCAKLRPDTDAALRVVGEEIAVRLLLAHCLAEAALATPDATKALERRKAALLAEARKLGKLAGDTNGVVPTVCEAVISSVFGTAARLSAR
jgi:hypothetical protein